MWNRGDIMLPSISQLIEISLDDGENFFYKSRIASKSDDYLGIELPIDKRTGGFKLITEGMEIKIYYLSSSGQYSFSTKVIGMVKEQIPIILIELPEEYKRIQRRNFIRVPAFVEVSYKELDDYDSSWNIVKTIDISGGGMQFVIPILKNIKFNQEIKGWIVLPYNNGKIEHIKFIGRVVRVYKSREKSDINLISIEFIDINEIMRAKIIKYSYEKQVKLKIIIIK